jgi:SET domain-containing protein
MAKHLTQKRRPIEKNRLKKQQGMTGSPIVWQRVPGKGRGVFTVKAIRKGALIEVAPVVPIGRKSVPEGAPPDGYVLEWDEKKKGREYAMVLGYVMLYNHSGQPNIFLESDLANETVTVTALRDIKAGEELLWNYNCEIWFDAE